MAPRFRTEFAHAVRPLGYASLLAAGVTRGRLDGPRWRASSRGWYVPADVARTPTQRILGASVLLPDGGAVGDWSTATTSA